MARASESIRFSDWNCFTPSHTVSVTRVFISLRKSVLGRAMSISPVTLAFFKDQLARFNQSGALLALSAVWARGAFRMLGLLRRAGWLVFGDFLPFFGKQVRSNLPERHLPWLRNSLGAPLRNSLWGYIANDCNRACSAKGVYECVLICIHKEN